MFKEEILNILHDIGIYVEQVEMDYRIGELLEDSLSFISFFIEVESKYDIEFPEKFFTEQIYKLKLIDFQKIVEALKVGNTIDPVLKSVLWQEDKL